MGLAEPALVMVSRYQPGERVFAIRNGDQKDMELYVFGPGTYVGDEVPPVKGFDYPNPRIDLDNGDVTWGMECWWGDEAGIRLRYPEGEGEGKWKYVEVRSKIGAPV